MKLSHFAQALTLALVAATAWLAWQAQQESSLANAKVDRLAQQQKAVNAAQAEASGNLVPGLATPMAMTSASSLPPLPTIPAAAPVPAPAPLPATVATTPATMPRLPGPLPAVKERPATASAAPVSKPAGSPAAADAPAPSEVPLMTPMQRRVKDSPAVGKVKEAVIEQGFVALDVGSKNGLKKGLKLDLRRESSIVGRVTVTDVEESESIADLDLKSIPEGVKIQPGDELISVVLAR